MNSQNTPVHVRLWHRDFWLMTFANLGLIPMEDVLALGQFPGGANKLLEWIESRKQQAQGQTIGADYDQKKQMLTAPTEA